MLLADFRKAIEQYCFDVRINCPVEGAGYKENNRKIKLKKN